MRSLVLGAALAAAALAAAAAGAAPPRAPATADRLTCLERSQIRETRVIDDRTIDFVTAGGVTYRNTLPDRCPGLGFERAFSYETSLSRLCSVDFITVFRAMGPPRQGAGCGLGEFHRLPTVPRRR